MVIQKRDKKAFAFQIVLPSILVALVLLVLTIDVPLAGPALPLSVHLYQKDRKLTSPARTDVIFGGGAHGMHEDAKQTFHNLEKLLTPSFERVEMNFHDELKTSSQVSQELLDSINDHSHALRFGSYLFNDTIPININIDWSAVKYEIENFNNDGTGNLPFSGDLTNFMETALGWTRRDDYIYFTFNTDEVENIMRDILGFSLETTLNLTDAIRMAEDFVREYGFNDTQPEDIREAIEEAVIDEAIEEFLTDIADNNTISTREFLDGLVDLTGGNTTSTPPTPGWITLEGKNFKVDGKNRTIEIDGFVMILGGGRAGQGQDAEVIDLGDVFITVPATWREDLENFLPDGFVTVQYNNNVTHSIVHNATSPHALPAFAQTLFQGYFQQCESTKAEQEFRVINHPLPLTAQQSIEIKTVLSLFASLFILIPYCYIPAAFTVFIVRERASKSKHLQLVSGVRLSAYWLSTYAFDICLFAVLTFFIMCAFTMYGAEAAKVFVGEWHSFLATLLLTFFYGTSSLPFSYLLSRNFTNHTTAQIGIMGVFFVTGFVAVNSYFIMLSLPDTEATAIAMVPYLRLFPGYNVGEGFINLSGSFYRRTLLGIDTQPFDYEVTGMNITNMMALSVLYSFIIGLLEYSDDGGGGGIVGNFLRKWKIVYSNLMLRLSGVKQISEDTWTCNDGLLEDEVDDKDVADEKALVANDHHRLRGEAAILIKGLWKIYPPSVGVLSNIFDFFRRQFRKLRGKQGKTPVISAVEEMEEEEDDNDGKPHVSRLPKRAVRGVSTVVTKGECFGLLGVNGAGKTTTLGILTGEMYPTGGEAYVCGFDVGGDKYGKSEISDARKHIGFCPQVDPLLDLMTGRETLRMFAHLRGKSDCEGLIAETLVALGLGPHADKCAGAYSGGNKRKLSLGVALIGDPSVVFLDEPSSGMDPVARRKMWDILEKLSKNRSVILTTHSMEEAEALCTRIGIMVAGKMRCLGSPQHLKSRFLDGYNIDVHCDYSATDEDIDRVEAFIVAEFGATVDERFSRFLRFSVTSLGGGLGGAFMTLESGKRRDDYKILDYAVTQCSLEQVFIKLASRGDGAAVGGGIDLVRETRAGSGGHADDIEKGEPIGIVAAATRGSFVNEDYAIVQKTATAHEIQL